MVSNGNVNGTGARTITRPVDKFTDPDWTVGGQPRAEVVLDQLQTLWFNTGTLCNITCRNCYIESSPTNDRLKYLSVADIEPFLREAKAAQTREIGFTGGEPFLNPDMVAMIEAALDHDFDVLVLTNAMLPMLRPQVASRLADLNARLGKRLTMRVSLDHYTAALHETERGPGSFSRALAGLDWLSAHGFQVAIAGRTCWGEDEAVCRAGYRDLIHRHHWPIDADDPTGLMLFPEMNEAAYDGPEISTACWGILGLAPSSVMCARSRMVVKRDGATRPVVLPCTLIPYDNAFEMGHSLESAARANGPMFNNGAVKLCHPNCAKFCVLGGGSCS